MHTSSNLKGNTIGLHGASPAPFHSAIKTFPQLDTAERRPYLA
ncbi:hypothetical protein [Rubritalea sp.]